MSESRRYRALLSATPCALAVAAIMVLSGGWATPSSGGSVPTARTAVTPSLIPSVPTASNTTWSWSNLTSEVGAPPFSRSMAQVAYDPPLNATILFGGYNGLGGNFPLGDMWEFVENTWMPLSPPVAPSARFAGAMVYDPLVHGLILFGGRNDTAFFNDTWEYNATGWHDISTPHAPSARAWFPMAYDPALGAIVLFGGMTGNIPAGTFTNFSYFNDTWTWAGGVWTNITATAGTPPVAGEHEDGMAYDAADGYLLMTAGSQRNQTCPARGGERFNAGGPWILQGGQWSEVAITGPAPPPGMGGLWFDSELNRTLFYEGMENNTSAPGTCPVSGNALWEYSAGAWTELSLNPVGPEPRTVQAFVDDQADHEQIMFGGDGPGYAQYRNDTWSLVAPGTPLYSVTFTESGLPAATTWSVDLETDDATSTTSTLAFEVPNGTFAYAVGTVGGYTACPCADLVAVHGANVTIALHFVKEVLATWTDLTSQVGTPPFSRSMAQAAYSPALGATILFGGYNGAGGNFEFGDTWQFVDNTWTELSPAVSPVPRFAGAIVYDPLVHGLILFGGRDNTAFFNDTWEYNATGWHNISTAHAPSARAWFGMAYDPALGAIVLFGGMTGNIPAGTFTNFTYFNDTWTWAGGVWTNITATAGTPPVAGEHEDGMAYDAADGYLLMTAGSQRNVSCYYSSTNVYSSGGPWMLAGGHWAEVSASTPAPPPGQGALWFDSELNRTLFYEGQENNSSSPPGSCPVYGNELWEYFGGNWTPFATGPVAPPPRITPVVVDDQADNEQIMFGGAGPYYAEYQADTWVLGPVQPKYNVTFDESGLPTDTVWTVALGLDAINGTVPSVAFSVTNGTYPYVVEGPVGYRVAGVPPAGQVVVHGAPVTLTLRFVKGSTDTVTFRESGLATGAAWCVTVGWTSCTTLTTQKFRGLTPGSYPYAVRPMAGEVITLKQGRTILPLVGLLALSARSTTLTLHYVYPYPIYFEEEGLPNGTSWSVRFGGTTLRSTGDLLLFEVPNGSYRLKVGAVAGFTRLPISGSLTVNGSGYFIEVLFTAEPHHGRAAPSLTARPLVVTGRET